MWLFQFHTSSTCLHWLNSALCSEPDALLAFTLIPDSFIGKHCWILFSNIITLTDQYIYPGIIEKLLLFCLMANVTVKKCKSKLYFSLDSCFRLTALSSSHGNLPQHPWLQLRRVTLGWDQFIWSTGYACGLLPISLQPVEDSDTEQNETSHPFLQQHHHQWQWHQDQTHKFSGLLVSLGPQGMKHIWFCGTVPSTQK